MRVTKSPEERKAEMIAAARELFEQNGIGDTSVSQIVRHVGVAQGLFYYYFRSKDEVVEAVADQILEELDRATREIIDDSNTDFYQKLLAFIDLYFSKIDSFQKGLFNEICDPCHASLKKFIYDRALAMNRDHLGKIIELGTDQGILKFRYPDLMITMIIKGIGSLIQERQPTKEVIMILVEQGLNLPNGSLAKRLPRPAAAT